MIANHVTAEMCAKRESLDAEFRLTHDAGDQARITYVREHGRDPFGHLRHASERFDEFHTRLDEAMVEHVWVSGLCDDRQGYDVAARNAIRSPFSRPEIVGRILAEQILAVIPAGGVPSTAPTMVREAASAIMTFCRSNPVILVSRGRVWIDGHDLWNVWIDRDDDRILIRTIDGVVAQCRSPEEAETTIRNLFSAGRIREASDTPD